MRRGVAGAGALERVADVVVTVLEHPGQVGVAGPREGDALCALALRLALRLPGAHPPGPVLVVEIADDEGERGPERVRVAESAEHLDRVGLELLAWAATVAELPTPQVGVDRVAVEPEPGGEPCQNGDERGPVRLARRDEAQ